MNAFVDISLRNYHTNRFLSILCEFEWQTKAIFGWELLLLAGGCFFAFLFWSCIILFDSIIWKVFNDFFNEYHAVSIPLITVQLHWGKIESNHLFFQIICNSHNPEELWSSLGNDDLQLINYLWVCTREGLIGFSFGCLRRSRVRAVSLDHVTSGNVCLLTHGHWWSQLISFILLSIIEIFRVCMVNGEKWIPFSDTRQKPWSKKKKKIETRKKKANKQARKKRELLTSCGSENWQCRLAFVSCFSHLASSSSVVFSLS